MVTFPSLYVFGALVGARLSPVDALRVIVAAVTVNLAVLASLGPITAFFTLTTKSYPFMKLLSVAFFRSDAWGNAYVVIVRLTRHFLKSILGL